MRPRVGRVSALFLPFVAPTPKDVPSHSSTWQAGPCTGMHQLCKEASTRLVAASSRKARGQTVQSRIARGAEHRCRRVLPSTQSFRVRFASSGDRRIDGCVRVHGVCLIIHFQASYPHLRMLLQVLGLALEHSIQEARRRYRDLALMLHPDKCTLAGAEEAFKCISAAMAALEETKR